MNPSPSAENPISQSLKKANPSSHFTPSRPSNKAVGLDKIGARLLKDSMDVITPSLTNLQINIVNYLHECELL